MCTERRSEKKQREKNREKQGHDDKEIVNFWVPSEGEPACHHKPYCSAHSDLDYGGMNTRLSCWLLQLMNGEIRDEKPLA
jgi:hypothetical protein